MKKNFIASETGELEVSVEYAREDYVPFLERAEKILVQSVSVKGFRKGKAPFAEARRHIHSDDLYNKMVDLMIKSSNRTLLEGNEEGYVVANGIQPTVDIKFDQEKDVHILTYKLILAPRAILGKVSGFTPKVEESKIGEKEVQDRIEALAKEQGVLEVQDDAYEATTGDVVNIDAIGYVDGKGFDGGVVKAYDLEIGSNTFVPGFEEQLIGITTGTRKNIEIVFPENYVREYANKPANFDTTVNSIKKKVYPEIDDEFAKSITKYQVTNLEELKKAIQEDLDKEAQTNRENLTLNSIIDQIVEDAKFIINDQILSAEKNGLYAKELNNLKQYGISLEDYLSITKLSSEDFDKQLEDQALSEIKRYAVNQAIISGNKFSLTDEDYKSFFGGEEQLKAFNAQLADLDKKDHDQASGIVRRINNDILIKKVKNFLLENNGGSLEAKKTTTIKSTAKKAEGGPVKKTTAKKAAEKKEPTTKSE